MLRDIMDLATLSKHKPEVAKNFLQKLVKRVEDVMVTTKRLPIDLSNADLSDKDEDRDTAEDANWKIILEEIQRMKNDENTKFIRPVDAFDYIAGMFIIFSIALEAFKVNHSSKAALHNSHLLNFRNQRRFNDSLLPCWW